MTFLPLYQRHQVHDHLVRCYARNDQEMIVHRSNSVKEELRKWQALQIAKAINDKCVVPSIFERMIREFWYCWENSGYRDFEEAMEVLKQQEQKGEQAMEIEKKSDDELMAEAFETLKMGGAERMTPEPTLDNATAMALLELQIGNLRLPGDASSGQTSSAGQGGQKTDDDDEWLQHYQRV